MARHHVVYITDRPPINAWPVILTIAVIFAFWKILLARRPLRGRARGVPVAGRQVVAWPDRRSDARPRPATANTPTTSTPPCTAVTRTAFTASIRQPTSTRACLPIPWRPRGRE